MATQVEATMEASSRQEDSLSANDSIETLLPAATNSRPASSTGEIDTDSAPESLPQHARKPASPSSPVPVDSGQEAPASKWAVPTQPSQRESSADMRPPPAKRQRIHNYDRRPRLSICPSVSPDAELVEDRDRNDNTLKGKFEAIFEKYGRDFSGVGDEINIMTGEVMVDNGHILSMDHETDPGSPSRARPSMLREDTIQSVTPMRQNGRLMTVGAEDVIASIEVMAQRVATGRTPYPEEEYDEEWYESGDEMQLYQRSGSVSSDSLFGDDYQNDGGSRGSVQQDSLLGYEEQDSSIESFYDGQGVLPTEDQTTFRNSKSGSMEEPILLTSGPLSAPDSDPFSNVTSYHGQYQGHPPPPRIKAKPNSPAPFVKSNGKQKIVAKKFNVSKAFEELQRQASTTPAAISSQQGVPQAMVSSKPAPSALKAATKKAKPKPPPQQARVGTTVRNEEEILRRLPVPTPSSETRTIEGDYESDDPLAL